MKNKQPDLQSQKELLVLIDSAKSGDETAAEQLFDRYAGLIRSKARAFLTQAPSEDELYSEASLAFWDAVNRYDDASGEVTFGLFAQICIKNRLLTAARRWKHLQRTVSLDDEGMTELQATEDSDPARYIVEQEQYDGLRRLVEETLSPKERSVWLHFAAGLSVPEIAAELHMERKTVENAVFRARKKLRAALPHHR